MIDSRMSSFWESKLRMPSVSRRMVRGARSPKPPASKVSRRAMAFWPTWISREDLTCSRWRLTCRASVIIATSAIFIFRRAQPIPLKGTQLKGILLVDYDNDGWLDIIGYGQGLRVWRNRGKAGFEDVTGDLGLEKIGSVDALVAADFDNDGDTDLILSSTKGLQ